MDIRLTVGEVAKVLGMTTENIRYYVREGLIKPEKNPENNYWEYSSEDVLLISDVLFYRDLGISINNIKKIFNGLPLEDIESVIEETKKDIRDRILKLSRLHSRLQVWEDAYREELKQIGRMSIEEMPAFLRKPEDYVESEHIVRHMENSLKIAPDEWMNVSLSFFVDVNREPFQVRRYMSLAKNVHTTSENMNNNVIETESVMCIRTCAHLVDDVHAMIDPIIEYAKSQDILLTGEFYGWEQTNYYVDHKRHGVYSIYAPIRT